MSEETTAKPSGSDTMNSLVGQFTKTCGCRGLSEPPKIYDGQTMLTGDTCSISQGDMKPPVCTVCRRVWSPNVNPDPLGN